MLSGIIDHSASDLVIFENQVRVRKKVTIENLLFPNDVISQEIKTELKLFCRSHV